MSNAVTALNGANYQGLATIADQGLTGMITLRGDLASAGIKAAVKSATGLDVPAQRQALMGKGTAALWMSPDELLLLRTFLRISGSGAREVLAKVCPVDLSPEGFTPGMFRRTRMAQVPAAFWLDEAGNFHLICFRSVADYAFELLKVSAQPPLPD